MGRLLQRLVNASHTTAGAEDVATDLVSLPHGAVLVGLADLGEELETHLVLARTIKAMAQIGGGTFILLLVVRNAARCSRAGERQCGQRNAEWTICANWTGCCACPACCCCCCRLDWTSGLRCGLLLLAIVELLLFGVAHRRVCEFLGRMWMRWLCGCTHWHNALTAETPEIWIEEIEAIGQTRTWRCVCERRISQQCWCCCYCWCWCWPLPVLLQKSGVLQDKQCAVPVTQHSFYVAHVVSHPGKHNNDGPNTQPPPQLPSYQSTYSEYCPLPIKSVYVDVRPFTILFTDPLLP